MKGKILLLLIVCCFNTFDSLAQVKHISKDDIIGKWKTSETYNGSQIVLILKKDGQHKLIFRNERYQKTKYYGSWELSDSAVSIVFDSLTSKQIPVKKASTGLATIELEMCGHCESTWLIGTIYELMNERMTLAIPTISNRSFTFYRKHPIRSSKGKSTK